jgi:hypothetical protein
VARRRLGADHLLTIGARWNGRCVKSCEDRAVSTIITCGALRFAACDRSVFFQSLNFMNQQSSTSSKNFPIDNLVYDLMMIIAKKSKGLKAMDQYLQDAQNNQRVKETFEKIRKHDEECVRELTQHLSYLVGQQKAAGR